MKKAIFLSMFLAFSFLLLSSCTKKPDYSVTDSSSCFPVEITELTSEQREKITAEYTPNGTDESTTTSNTDALALYDALDMSSFQEIETGKDFFTDIDSENSIYLWLYTDKEEMLKGSCGCFTVYANDIVCYSFSPIVSSCFYYKAPTGTYKTVTSIITKTK